MPRPTEGTDAPQPGFKSFTTELKRGVRGGRSPLSCLKPPAAKLAWTALGTYQAENLLIRCMLPQTFLATSGPRKYHGWKEHIKANNFQSRMISVAPIP